MDVEAILAVPGIFEDLDHAVQIIHRALHRRAHVHVHNRRLGGVLLQQLAEVLVVNLARLQRVHLRLPHFYYSLDTSDRVVRVGMLALTLYISCDCIRQHLVSCVAASNAAHSDASKRACTMTAGHPISHDKQHRRHTKHAVILALSFDSRAPRSLAESTLTFSYSMRYMRAALKTE